MKCPKCKAENNSTAYYCHECGNKLRGKINGWGVCSFILCIVVLLLGGLCLFYYCNGAQNIQDIASAEQRAINAEQRASKAERELNEARIAIGDANQRAENAEHRATEAEKAVESARQAQHMAEQRASNAEKQTEDARKNTHAIVTTESSRKKQPEQPNPKEKTYAIGDDVGNYKIAYVDYSGKHGFAVKDGGEYECIVPDISITELEALYRYRYTLKLRGEHWSSTKSSGGKYYTYDFSTGEKKSRRKCAGKKYKYLDVVRF